MESFPKKEQTPFENLNIKEQWDSQVEIMGNLGILQTFPELGIYGIKGIDGKEYAVPTYEDIQERLEANKEEFELKIKQGFKVILIEPFGYSIDKLIKKYESVIVKHHKTGKLFATKEKDSDPDESLDLDVNQPIYTNDNYKKEGNIVYFPKEFSEKHQGKTKKELLLEDPKNGFNIWLIEENPNIPREGKGVTIGSRPQLETNKTSTEYLNILKTNKIYKHESGLTPEADIMLSILRLEQKNQVSNDYRGKGALSYQIGSYFVSGVVPNSYWYRVIGQAYLSGFDPSAQDSYDGFRPGVRV